MNQIYTINTDGGSRGNPGPSAIGFSITKDDKTIACGGWPIGVGTNNEAEYKALIWGLKNALALGIKSIDCIADSELMVKQINGSYKINSKKLKPLFAEVKELASKFLEFSISHVLRSSNKEPDAMVNQALDMNCPVGSYKVEFDAEPSSLFDVSGLCGAPSVADMADMVDTAVDAPDTNEGCSTSTNKPIASFSTPQNALSNLDKKTVLVGVTGCIAAYKTCEIVRSLQKAGARVKVCMTEHATKFVGPATFRALTNEEVAVELFDSAEAPIHHISLAKEADLILIAPCTANVLTKLAYGIADDLLTTTVLASTAPLVVAPAMNTNMWENQKTQDSLAKLRENGALIVEPETGYLSCGDSGAGRLADIETIANAVLDEFSRSQSLLNKKILITTGPTHEPIDPVRYIGNRSSGLTGITIAKEAASRGAEVVLVAGPISLSIPANVKTIHIQTALEMLDAAKGEFDACDAAVFCAAVADFRPKDPSEQKIKKSELDLENMEQGTSEAGDFSIELVRNPDILKLLAANKGNKYVVGFAAETCNVLENAKQKLEQKNADMIVANDVSSSDLGFGTKDNRVWLVSRDDIYDSGVVSKNHIAKMIVDKIQEAIC